MVNDFLYMAGVVLVGWAVTFAMRALPFVLFSGGKGAPPAWVERLGTIISPIIIAALIVYSYSALQWRTPWPYIAGATTVLLHIWKKNALASILAGTIVYMCLLMCGCSTADSSVSYGRSDPLIAFTVRGLKFDDKYVTPKEAVELLGKYNIPKDTTLHLLIEPDYKDQRAIWVFQRNYLARAGYTKSIQVSQQKAESRARSEEEVRLRHQNIQRGGSRSFRYKSAEEL